ncbi:hypothetical protein GCM10027019_16170 [Melaminivora jejuensis]
MICWYSGLKAGAGGEAPAPVAAPDSAAGRGREDMAIADRQERVGAGRRCGGRRAWRLACATGLDSRDSRASAA